MAAGKRCCDDDFTTLSSRQQRIAWAALLVSIIFFLILTIYFLAVKPSAFTDHPYRGHPESSAIKDAYLHSEGWRPRCSEEPPKPEERFDCYPEQRDVSEELCYARGCCWILEEADSFATAREEFQDPIPRCYYPLNYGYVLDGPAEHFRNGFEVPLKRLSAPSRYGNDVEHLRMRVEMQTTYRLRVKFYDISDERYEVPDPKLLTDFDYTLDKSQKKLYDVEYNSSDTVFGLKVRRPDTKTAIFDTTVGGFTFAHQFLQISVHLPSFNVYGFGEHEHKRFRHNFTWRTWTMFANHPSSHDASSNLYGVHPMYMCVEEGGNTHGVLLLNSNAMEVQMQPLPALTFRTTGGVLDFYIFLGPTPEDVVKQYTEAIGRPLMPPYWALGFHLSRSQYDSISHLKDVLARMKVKGIPQDVQHLGLGYMDGLKLFTYDNSSYSELPNLINELHSETRKVILNMHPGVAITKPDERYIPYEKGMDLGVFVNTTWGHEPIRGKLLDIDVVYPDFGNPVAVYWWTDNMRQLKKELQFDGISLEMNEPLNSVDYCLDDNLNRPPYIPKMAKKSLTWNTLCMDSVQRWDRKHHRHYDLHNLYGHFSGLATAQAMHSLSPNRRLLVVSESTYVGSGKYVGHFLSTKKSDWDSLASSIGRMLEFNMFGIPLVGSDICGTTGDVDEELCLRWFQLGLFYPLARSNKQKGFRDQDPAIFCSEFSTIIRKTILTRYELLPYLYTQFYFAHTTGSTVVRPLFHEFWTDYNTYDNDRQFLWGPALMISPVLTKNVSSHYVYFPSGWWFDYYTGDLLEGVGGWKLLTAPFPDLKKFIPLHIRGGYIIPAQVPANTTTLGRKNPMKLFVALNSAMEATGSLFWDDGETVDSHLLGEYVFLTFSASNNKLEVKGTPGKKLFSSDFNQLYIETIQIMGLRWKPVRITINDDFYVTKKQYSWHPGFKVLRLHHILIPLSDKTVIKWYWR